MLAGDANIASGNHPVRRKDSRELPEDCRPAADAILLSAAQAGMGLPDLAGLAAEMYERSRPDRPNAVLCFQRRNRVRAGSPLGMV
jgi:hypothetical protein